MTDFLLNAHSGWRYLVLTATIFVALYFLFALLTGRTSAKQETTVLRVWPILIDIQVALGILLIVVYIIDGTSIAREYLEHGFLGLIIAGVAHTPAMMRRRNLPTQSRRLMGLLLPLAVIGLAIVSIGLLSLGLFEMSA